MRQLQALRSVACEAEFAEVIARSQFGLDQAGCARLLERWRACSESVESVRPATLACTDADDQKFLDAAFGAGADGLLTRDKALLQLARRAAAMGLAICTPGEALPRYGLHDRAA